MPEQDNNTENQATKEEPKNVNQPEVGFPESSKTKKKGGGRAIRWVIALIGVLLIIGVGGWFILKTPGGDTNDDPNKTPSSQVLSDFPTPEPTPEQTPTPKPDIEKSEVVIEILNGTGTAGDATLVKNELEDLDYVEITADNADDQDETITTVTFDRDLPDALMDEITEALEDLFGEVKIRKASLTDLHVRILTGPKTGSSETPTPEPEETESPSPTPTATPEGTE